MLLFQGGQKRIIEIENTVFSLLGDTNLEVQEATEKTDPEQNRPLDSSEETQNKRTENLWNAVEEMKAQLNLLVPNSSINPPNDPKIIIEGKKLQTKIAALETTTITERSTTATPMAAKAVYHLSITVSLPKI